MLRTLYIEKHLFSEVFENWSSENSFLFNGIKQDEKKV